MICRHCGAVIDQRTWYPNEGRGAVVYHVHGEPLRPGYRTEWFALDQPNHLGAVNVCRKNAPSKNHEPR